VTSCLLGEHIRDMYSSFLRPACSGQYPAHPSFLQSVKWEAEYNVKRLAHQPSIVLWAGNNEDYQIAQNFKLEWDPKDTTGPWDKTSFPAREVRYISFRVSLRYLSSISRYMRNSFLRFSKSIHLVQTTFLAHHGIATTATVRRKVTHINGLSGMS